MFDTKEFRKAIVREYFFYRLKQLRWFVPLFVATLIGLYLELAANVSK